MKPITVSVPLIVKNESNQRGHWGKCHRRTKKEHKGVAAILAIHARHVTFPCVVTLTRVIGPYGRRLDDDGNVSAFKGVRDAVCKVLGITDGPKSPAKFRYAQERGEWGITIRIEEAGC